MSHTIRFTAPEVPAPRTSRAARKLQRTLTKARKLQQQVILDHIEAIIDAKRETDRKAAEAAEHARKAAEFAARVAVTREGYRLARLHKAAIRPDRRYSARDAAARIAAQNFYLPATLAG